MPQATIVSRSGPGALLLLAAPGLASGQADDSHNGHIFQLELANDVVLSSDNQFTNGVGFHLHSPLSRDPDDAGGTPAFGQSLARPFLPARDDLHYRETWVLGQIIQTPDDIETSNLILNDVPYAGALTWSNSYYAFNDQEFYGVQWMFGWVGTDAHAEATQKAVHTMIGGDNPRGWDNQLSSEPLINVQYNVRRKFYQSDWFDAAVSGDLALGNWTTFAQTGLEFRFGQLPDGFSYVPDPPGRGVDSYAILNNGSADYLYGTVTVRGTATAYNILQDGNLIRDDNEWTERNTIDRNTWTGQVILGAHYTTPRWGAHLTLWLATENIDEDGLASSEDPRNSFGSLMLDYHF